MFSKKFSDKDALLKNICQLNFDNIYYPQEEINKETNIDQSI